MLGKAPTEIEPARQRNGAVRAPPPGEAALARRAPTALVLDPPPNRRVH
jgi:hypothetical protein